MIGKIDWYSRKLSYGFLLPSPVDGVVPVGEDGEPLRYFFHRKNIDAPLGFQKFEYDDEVQFELSDFKGKVVAVKRYPIQSTTPIEILKYLIEVNGLRQVDLVSVFGTKSIVSEILSGKRKLNTYHITKLSERFGISPALFF